MGGGTIRKSDARFQGDTESRWPVGARLAVSALIALHAVAIVSAALAAAPSSLLERWVADRFAGYNQLIDQGYAYRFYAPEPGPTPIVLATIRYTDGRPETVVRLPQRGVLPRLRYQRQLALANHLVENVGMTRAETGEASQSPYARSYAKHLAKSHPGAATVTLHSQVHLIPDPRRIGEARESGKPIDIDDEEFYTVPELIGEFPCDGF